MKISVAMCTYNGEKYIAEQLKTLYYQTRQPDEVIIRDDGSTDRTVEIIREFIRKYSMENTWRLTVNSENVGWKRNFMKAIQDTNGDLIFLADQDDIWHSHKIELMSKVFRNNSKAHMCVCECFPFDTTTKRKVQIFLPKLGKGMETRISIRHSFSECLRPGCTYALHSDMKEYIAPLWKENWPHDLFFWCIALAQGSLYSCNCVLVKWRRHDAVNTQESKKTKDCRLGLLRRDGDIMVRLLKNAELIHISNENVDKIQKSLMVCRRRMKEIEKGSLIGLIGLVRYLSYYPKISSWFGDIVAAKR